MFFVVASLNNSRFNVVSDSISSEYKGRGGTEYELLKTISDAMQFSYRLVLPHDKSWGVESENGSWNGLIGLLQRKEADFAINIISISQSRARVVEYSFPYTVDRIIFAMKKAGEASKDFVCFYPFQSTVWIATILCFMLCCILLVKFPRTGFRHLYFLDAITCSAETLAGLRGFEKNKDTPLRVFLGVYKISTAILSFSFVAVFLSFLMSPVMNHQIKTVQELARASVAGKVKVTVGKNTSVETLVIAEEEGTFRDLSTNLRKHPETFKKLTEGAVSVVMAGYALIFSENRLWEDAFKNGKSEEVFVSEEALSNAPYAIAFRKDFCCVNNFSNTVLRMQQAGIYQKVLNDHMFKTRLYGQKFESKFEKNLRPISLSDTKGAIWIASIFYAISIFILLLEICFKK